MHLYSAGNSPKPKPVPVRLVVNRRFLDLIEHNSNPILVNVDHIVAVRPVEMNGLWLSAAIELSTDQILTVLNSYDCVMSALFGEGGAA